MKIKIQLSFFFFFTAYCLMGQHKTLSTYDRFLSPNFKLSTTLPKFDKWTNSGALFSHLAEQKYYLVTSTTGAVHQIDSAKYKTYLADHTDQKVRLEHKSQNLWFISGDNSIQLTDDSLEYSNPTLSPDQSTIAFTRHNNLYLFDIATRTAYPITFDDTKTVLNGYASWVYMEEILGRSTQHLAFWWSPDSRKIAFYRFDDTEVPEFTITDGTGIHGYVEKWRYPKPGDKLPKVNCAIYQLANKATVWAQLGNLDDQYLAQPYWSANSQQLWVQWANRIQNHLKIFAVEAKDGAVKQVYEEKQATWINIDDDQRVCFATIGKKDRKKRTIDTIPVAIIKSDRTGWDHLYLYTMAGDLLHPITQGQFSVKKVVKVDHLLGKIFFIAQKEHLASDDLYSVQIDGKGLKRLTFGASSHSVSISPDSKYAITTHSHLNQAPQIALIHLDRDAEVHNLWTSTCTEAVQDQVFSEIIMVKSDDGQFDLPLRITWPVGMDRTKKDGKKYPVLIDVYGGPSSMSVRNTWNNNPYTYWYAHAGLIQVSMDHRGSAHFGRRGQNALYQQLGKWEVIDYSTLVAWLIEHAQADSSRIAIRGFSYGGYISAFALATAPKVFTHAMAGGSVTSWNLYDATYTERFMNTPSNNPLGYKNSGIAQYVPQITGKLQITHGVLDENVHLQNTLQLIDQLQEHNKSFEMMLYPQSRHGYRGKKSIHFKELEHQFIVRELLNQ